MVHGGVYTTAVESAASLGASAVVEERGQFAVGVNKSTDFLRPMKKGRVGVIAEPSPGPKTGRRSPAAR